MQITDLPLNEYLQEMYKRKQDALKVLCVYSNKDILSKTAIETIWFNMYLKAQLEKLKVLCQSEDKPELILFD